MTQEQQPPSEPSENQDPVSVREHELQTFLRQDLAEMSSEYRRIYSRTTEDPGTAGDEGEENWAHLLRQWLPDAYKVVTKGRILGTDGRASPQIDVLILKPGYPQRLLSKKVYLVDGVAAAFECKTTLKSNHLREAATTAARVRRLSGAKTGSPYRELTGLPTYGVLAHSHSWKGAASTPRENVDRVLEEVHQAAAHPRDLLDIVCIADLECWVLTKSPYAGRATHGDLWPELRNIYGFGEEGGGHTSYGRSNSVGEGDELADAHKSNPLGVGIAMILQHLAWEGVSVRPLADYFRLAGIWGASSGPMRHWRLGDLYTAPVANALVEGGVVNSWAWTEWRGHFP